MKYFSIFLLSFAIITPVFAAKMVPGEVPSVRPLQPIPMDIYPNPKNNIQFEDPSHRGQFDANGNLVNQSRQSTGQNSGQPAASQSAAGNSILADKNISAAGRAAESVKKHYIIWPGFVLALLALGYWGYKKSQVG